VRAEFDAVRLDVAHRRQAEHLDPPLSVRIGPGQLMNWCSPPAARMMSMPGRMLR